MRIIIQKIRDLFFRYKELIKYTIVGGLTTLVSLGSYYICVLIYLDSENPIELQVANIISWICAVSFAYITNRKFVFESNEKRKLREVTKFVVARITTLVIDMCSMAILVSMIDMNDKIAKVMVQFIVFSLNYIFSKLLVFKKYTN